MNDTFSRLSRLLIIVFLLAAGLAIPSGTASAVGAAKFTVNSISDPGVNDGICTLSEAVYAAVNDTNYHGCTNTGSGFGNDQIVFHISGSTTITLTADLPAVTTGNLTIDGTNSGHSVVIDGANLYEPFSVSIGATLTLVNLTVQHGLGGFGGFGGGVYNAGTLNVLHTTFLNNVATPDDGGAIENDQGTVTVANSTFKGNSSGNFGGAINNIGGTATILNSTFSANSAAVHGGALSTWNAGNPPVTTIKNTIMANSIGVEDCYNGISGTLTGDHNIIETTASYGIRPTCSVVTTSTADPKLAAQTGSPAYFPLLFGSPALNAGSDLVCAASPVSNTSENGKSRPQGAHCEIGSFESIVFKSTLKSVGAQDGWVLESSETSSMGGSVNNSTTTFLLGDDANNRQYRSLASFPTGAALPDTAHITGVSLKLKVQGVTIGPNPVTTLLGFMLDIKKGSFGTPALQTTDFQAGASHTFGPFITAPVGGWYSFDLTSGAGFVNKLSTSSGLTQVRLRFNMDDNNDATPNYLSLYSGNAPAASQPQLVIQYYLP